MNNHTLKTNEILLKMNENLKKAIIVILKHEQSIIDI